ncbi:unnamed protein product [Callosobruchus maculatus]|uniref:Uncharacterized protein n=1 Tax=Callosobruchus maculatus TaxID=64391 RepID=A0A653CTU2_CALMS|nr:unnamed protein product [Callosobruchus maculatus]
MEGDNKCDTRADRVGEDCKLLDNKGMVTPTPSERACPPPVHVNIGADTEKPPQQDSPPFRIWRKVRLPHAINGFLAVFGE